MATNDLEEDILIVIEEDNIDDFITLTNKFKDWTNYLIQDEKEYFIHYALKNKSAKIIKYILKYGVDPNLKDGFSQNPLHIALNHSLCEISSALINNEEYEFSCDTEGNTEYHKWISHYCLKCLNLLMNRQPIYNLKNKKQNNPLHQSVIENNIEALRLLMENCQFNLEEEGENKLNLIQLACVYSELQVFKYVHDLNFFTLEILTNSNETLLNLSLKNRKFAIAEELVNLSVTIASRDLRLALEESQIKLYRKMKEIYDEQAKSGKNRSRSKNQKVNEYSSSESNSNEVNLNYNLSKSNNVNMKSEIKSSIINPKNKEYSKLKINEVSLSHKKPNLQNKLFAKYQNGDSSVKSAQDNLKTNDKSPLNSEEAGGSENANMKVIKFESIKNISIEGGEVVRKFSDNYPNMKSLSERRSCSQSKSIKEQSKKNEDEILNKKIDIDSIIKIDYVKSFSNLDFIDLKFEYQIYEAEVCVVFKGKYKALPVAIKIYSLSRLTEENIKSFNYEINLLMSLRHPNIVTFIGYCYNKNNFYLITEFMENKSLKYVLENKKINLTLLDKLNMCLDISLAIYYLHTRNPLVLHRDLKSSNCLVDKNNKIKLCDFGLSKIYENSERQTNSSSTCFWMAPEFIVERLFNEKSDIYSLGILFWEIFMRDTIPYKGMNELTFLLGDIEVLKKRPHIPENFDTEVRHLIESCWNMDFNKRPNISTVVEIIEVLINKNSSN